MVHLGRFTAAVTCAVALVAGGCSSDDRADLGDIDLVAALRPFEQCDDLLGYLKEEAASQVGPWGLGGGVMAMEDMALPASREAAATAGGAPTSAAPVAGDSPTSGTDESAVGDGANAATNNQEADVDEADLVKVDGDRIVSVRDRELLVTDLVAGAPYLTARVALGEVSAGKLFLVGDRAYVLGTSTAEVPTPMTSEIDPATGDRKMADVMPIGLWSPHSTITEVALGDAPSLVSTTVVEGNILDGRMVDGTLRLVLSSQGGTQLGFVMPSGDGGQASLDRATEANRSVIEESTAEDWLPAIVDGDERRPLLDCSATYHPAEFSGLSMLSILTIADGLGSLTATGVLADSQVTYASAERLYVATTRWSGSPVVPMGGAEESVDTATTGAPDVLEHTDLHTFDIGGTKAAEYLASGRVDGQLLNQYSMSDRAGRLRIATTVSSGSTGSTDSRVTVLERSGRELREVGSVRGLGAGETIRSVRFVDELAYVVTFRQTDPFYVLDLSDPTAPRKLGELKVPGFSAYLHPVGERLVLGVGSDASDEGRIRGAKLSLYDTSDPVAPREVATWTAADLQFLVDGDPKAFAWDAERRQALLPYAGACWSDTCSNDAWTRNGMLVVRVTAEGIAEVGRIDHADRTPSAPPAVDATTTTTVPETTTTAPTETTTSTTAPPETTVPETTVPETTAPETTVPGAATGGATARSSEASAPAAPSGDVASGSPGMAAPECGPAVDCVGPEPMPYVEPMPTILRAFVVGDRIVTLSDAGIATHDATTLARTGYAPF